MATPEPIVYPIPNPILLPLQSQSDATPDGDGSGQPAWWSEMQPRRLQHKSPNTWIAHRLGHLLQVSSLSTSISSTKLLPLKSRIYNVFMLPFLSHLLCGPCGRESVTQGVCFACHVSLNCQFHPHPPCIRNGYYL